jgi:hypothetical protein
MCRPEDPIKWPEHFPPTDRVKKFFIGVRTLGPDITFFPKLKKQQAARGVELMTQWQVNSTEVKVLDAICEVLYETVRWKGQVFLPNDEFRALLYGPAFTEMDETGITIDDIEHRLNLRMEDSFWHSTQSMTLVEVVKQIAEQMHAKT